MAYIKEIPLTLTLGATGASSGLIDSADINGILHSVRVRANGFIPAPGAYISYHRKMSSGTTEQTLLRVSGTTFSSAWTEYFPRATIQLTSIGSTASLVAPIPIGDDGIKVVVETSAAYAARTITTIISIV